MSKFAVKMIEKNGVDVEKLLKLLIKNAGSEMSTYYHYNLLRSNLIGIEGEGLKEIVDIAKTEDKNHYEALCTRIYELGGELPDDLSEFYKNASCPPAHLPKDRNNTIEIIRTLRDAEQCAMAGYNEICKITFDKDFRTYDLSLAILHEETEHESWFSEFLGEEPSGHFMRKGESSPFVRKFLH